eukprot:TRINITY_DN88678_c0_g1_i1.p2 TRINITY_DN88678_c0_g1~~TRINITY_DN88678_c0_g1_i1.p2  ORF type:complete len:156 (-),score=15.26 TRINITY_DN88678_c0_g1_i1:102-569(-)
MLDELNVAFAMPPEEPVLPAPPQINLPDISIVRKPGKRKIPENDSESIVSTSEKSNNAKPSPRKARLKKASGLINMCCPYCKQKMVLNENNFEKHLAACFKKQEKAPKVEKPAKRSTRATGRADRYSPEVYSEKAYKYFKKREHKKQHKLSSSVN